MGTRRTLVRERGRELKVRILLDGLDGGPEATHSHQPGSKVRPHYHLGAQFQLVVRGTATYPTFDVEAIGVHYTDHNTPYGPFETTEDYEMFVLHAKPAGQLYMDTPENRSRGEPRGPGDRPVGGRGRVGRRGTAGVDRAEDEGADRRADGAAGRGDRGARRREGPVPRGGVRPLRDRGGGKRGREWDCAHAVQPALLGGHGARAGDRGGPQTG